jgi:hypothetical protein
MAWASLTSLESLFCSLVASVEIRMVLLGQIPEGCLDFVIACLRPQAECSIEITQDLPRAAIMEEQMRDAVRLP